MCRYHTSPLHFPLENDNSEFAMWFSNCITNMFVAQTPSVKNAVTGVFAGGGWRMTTIAFFPQSLHGGVFRVERLRQDLPIPYVVYAVPRTRPPTLDAKD